MNMTYGTASNVDYRLYVWYRREQIVSRIKEEAEWIIDNKCSLRQCVKEFNISKSQVHRDMSELKHIDDDTYQRVRHIIKKNKLRR